MSNNQQAGRSQCARRAPKPCTSGELRQQIECMQKQLDMTKEAFSSSEERTLKELKKTEDEIAAKKKEIDAMLSKIADLNIELDKVREQAQEKEAELITLHTVNQIETSHMSAEVQELRAVAEREKMGQMQYCTASSTVKQ